MTVRFAACLALFLIMTAHLNADSSIYEIPLVDIDGNSTTLESYRGKVLLVVNVASKCGFTNQYEGLEDLYDKYKESGLVVLGFPCNQFGWQEPGSEAEIKEFCSLTYGVTFPMYSKIKVNGSDRHPLYTELAGDESPFPGRISWNFNKFLVDKDGQVLGRFGSRTKPDSDKLIAEIEKALAGD